MIKQKFQEVALLVSNGFYSQSIDECFNGENIANSLNADLENLIVKLSDAGVNEELINFANQIKQTYAE